MTRTRNVAGRFIGLSLCLALRCFVAMNLVCVSRCATAVQFVLALLCAFWISEMPAAAAGRPGIVTVALSGMHAPGVDSGTTFRSISYTATYFGPSISPNGRVVFAAEVAAPFLGNSTAVGLWSGAPGDLKFIARQGSQAPSTPDGTIIYTGSIGPPINSSGQVAESAQLYGASVTSTNVEGIWFGSPTLDTLVARQGDVTPGLPDVRFGTRVLTFSDYAPALNDAGHVAFLSTLQNSAGANINGQAVWEGPANSMSLVARTGDTAPGTQNGTQFTGLTSPGLNASGIIAFLAGTTRQNPDGTSTTGAGIWGGLPGNISPLVRQGDPAPGMGADAFFQLVYFARSSAATDTHLNGLGEVMFFGNAAGPGVQGGVNSNGVWAGAGGNLTLVARQGDAAPDLGPDYKFSAFNNSGLSDVGTVAVIAEIAGPNVSITNKTGIWAGMPGNLRIVMRNGDSLTDLNNPAPLVMQHVDHLAMNAIGEMVFQSFPDTSVVASDVSGHLNIIARPGDMIEVTPGVFRTISQVFLLRACESFT